MTAPHIVDPAAGSGEALAEAAPDLMRQLLRTMINALLSADADQVADGGPPRPRPDHEPQRLPAPRPGYPHRHVPGVPSSSARVRLACPSSSFSACASMTGSRFSTTVSTAAG